MKKSKSSSPAFTIVELLIVIVVIGILAAITIVAYNGIQQRAKVASLSSDLTNSRRILMADQVTSGSYPATLAAANSGQGITASNGNTLSYTVNTTTTPQTFCLTATNGTTSYNISSTTPLSAGPCPVGWWPLNGTANDASGNGNNGTINGATSTTGVNGGVNGAMSFAGGYITTLTTGINPQSGSVSVWVNPSLQDGWGLWQTHDNNSVNWVDWIALFAHSNTNFYFRQGDGTACCNNDLTFITSSKIPVNQWTYVTFTWGANLKQIYINGILLSQRNANLQTAIDPYARIGFGHTYGMQGKLDDFRVYNRPLNSDEVQAIYKEGAR